MLPNLQKIMAEEKGRKAKNSYEKKKKLNEFKMYRQTERILYSNSLFCLKYGAYCCDALPIL